MILVVPFKYYILPKRTHGSLSGFREFRCVIVKKRANLCGFARAIFSLSGFLLVPCREFKKAVAAHHRQFSVLVTLSCGKSSSRVSLRGGRRVRPPRG